MESVVLRYCNGYEIGRIEGIIRESLSDLGIDLGREISGKRVLLKPNLLGAHLPEKGVTTHPAFVEALIRVLKGFDCQLWLGDSPNGVQKSLADVWNRTGMDSLCHRYGVVKRPFEREGATLVGDLLISNVVLEADYIINLPKFKTHGLTVLTGAVKNMFGVVPGLKKTDYHRIAQSKKEFATFLVRIAEVKKPHLNVVDGITAMAGNGPSGGYLVGIGLIAVGRDMHYVDLALAQLMGVDPYHVDTLEAAGALGLVDLGKGPYFLGNDIKAFNMAGYKLPVSYTSNLRDFGWFRFLVSRFMINMRVRPRVIKKRCVNCGMCVKICPVSCIKHDNGYPHIDNDECIECYCCHEVCPERAIELRESLCLKISKAIANRRD